MTHSYDIVPMGCGRAFSTRAYVDVRAPRGRGKKGRVSGVIEGAFL
jgi:hypothetical protein